MGYSTATGPSEKRYRTRRQWNNTRFVMAAAPFVVVPVTVIALINGALWLIGSSIVLACVLLVLAVVRDRRRAGEYRVSAEGIRLQRGPHRQLILSPDVLDASLMERSTCREYVRRRIASRGLNSARERRQAERAFTRFCSIDVGLSSFTFGYGRRVIDRMSNIQNDLLLLRSKSGHEFLLSPERNQEMMEQIARLKQRQSEGAGPDQL
jgi:hypothetical protein